MKNKEMEMSCKSAKMAKGMKPHKKVKTAGKKHSKEELMEAHKHMRQHGG